MAPVKFRRGLRIRLVLWAAAGLIAGLSLLTLSRIVHTPPAPDASAHMLPDNEHPQPGSDAAAANLSAMLFLLALVSLSVTAVAVGWLLLDVRRRTDWRTRTRHARR